MFNQCAVGRFILSLVILLSFSVVAGAQVKRYAVLGDDLAPAEAALTELGVRKIKSFRNFSGLAVNLSDYQAEALRANLGNGLRLINDQPFHAFDDIEIAKGKPGGGGGKPGGSSGQQFSWGISAVNAPAAWADPLYGTSGAGVAVCVVDSGLDMNHPDLSANIAGGDNYINGGSWDDDNGHGTHVGGIIAALDNETGVVGVAPQATLLAAKALDRRGSGTLTDLADAVYGCADLRAQHASGMPLVVNLSLTINGLEEEAQPLRDAIISVQNETGATFVGAAGNFGEVFENLIKRPARWEEVMAISGAQEDLSFWPKSGHGGFNDPVFSPDPAFIAPATEILSLWKGGKTKSLDGTSMSAAFASGVIALGLSVNSDGALGRDLSLPSNQQGGGLIDALMTVQNQGSIGGVAAVPEPSGATLLLLALATTPLVRRRVSQTK